MSKRKFVVQIIATVFMLLGLLNLGIFLWLLIKSPTNADLNLFFILKSALLYFVGQYLFRLREFGRKLTIVVVAVNIGWLILVFITLFMAQKDDFSFVLKSFGQPFFSSTNRSVVTVALFVQMSISIVIGIFLMSKRTQEIFNSTTNVSYKPPMQQTTFDINFSQEYAVSVSLIALSVMNARVYYQNKKTILAKNGLSFNLSGEYLEVDIESLQTNKSRISIVSKSRPTVLVDWGIWGKNAENVRLFEQIVKHLLHLVSLLEKQKNLG